MTREESVPSKESVRTKVQNQAQILEMEQRPGWLEFLLAGTDTLNHIKKSTSSLVALIRVESLKLILPGTESTGRTGQTWQVRGSNLMWKGQ